MDLRRQLDLERLLGRVARDLLSVDADDFQASLAAVLEAFARGVGASRCGWFVVSGDRSYVTVEQEWCRPDMEPSVGAMYTAAELPESFPAFLAGKDVYAHTDDLDGAPWNDFRDVVRAEGIAACLVAPAVRDGRVVGAVALDFAVAERAVADVLVELARRFADLVCLGAQRRAELEKTRHVEARLMQKQQLENLGLVAGGVAHDFNNALQVIRVSVDLLSGSIDSQDDEGNEHLELLTEATEGAADLARRMLVFAHQDPDASGITDTARALQRVYRMMERVAPPSVELRLLLDADLPKVPVRPGDFEQCVINLITNSLHAMPMGGSLTIKAQVHSLGQGPQVLITVTDTGSGMSEADLKRAGDPLFTTKSPGEGTGLGLSMVRAVAERASGHVRIRSTEGEGTSVQLWLPELASGISLPPPQPVPEILKGDETVLLLEDNVLVRRVAQSVLQRAGYAVVVTGREDEALELLRTVPEVALIVTDGRVPASDENDGGHPDLPILLCTAYAPVNLSSRPGSPGWSVLPKPWLPRDLLARVRQLLDESPRSRAAGESA